MKTRHMFCRCGLVRDQPAKGEDNEDWTPKRLTGSTGISGSLFLQHHRFVMLLLPKIFAGKEETRTIDEEKSKKGSWSNTTKLQTDTSVPLREKLATKTWRTLWTTPGQPTLRR